jgi:hypothetical protein
MGWETNVPTMLSFYKETYDKQYKVEDAIDYNKDYTNKLKRELFAMCIGNLKDFISEDYPDINSLLERIDEILSELEANFIEMYKLHKLKDNFNCVSGDYVKNPNYKSNIKEWAKENILPIIEYNEENENT